MRTFNLSFLGFGNVNRALVRLLHNRARELRERYGVEVRVTGVASRRLGWIASAHSLDDMAALSADPFDSSPFASAPRAPDLAAWLDAARPDVVFEATSLNVEDGQPAIDHMAAALRHGAHAITANKGPVVHAYGELRDLAQSQGKRFLFESTVMDGVPIFSLFQQSLPALRLYGFHGILNSTTNVILSSMEEGLSFEQALLRAQQIGVAETDAAYDIDGWDATVKVAALVTVLMDVRLPPRDVVRQGIRGLTAAAVRDARSAGMPFKLVCRAHRDGDKITASVQPEQVPLTDPMSSVTGTSSIVTFETDIFPALTITETDPGLYATAYGMFADFLRAVSPRP